MYSKFSPTLLLLFEHSRNFEGVRKLLLENPSHKLVFGLVLHNSKITFSNIRFSLLKWLQGPAIINKDDLINSGEKQNEKKVN